MQTSDTNSIKKDKSYGFWRKCMTLGEHTGCHQLPERSFNLHGYQMPLCARCTGVVLGYIAAIPIYIIAGFCRKFAVLGCLVMLTDWSLQAAKIKPSTNIRRFITGILGGYGIMSIQVAAIIKFLTLIRQYLGKE